MQSPIVETLLQIVHVITSVFLILVVLLQQGKGGGLGAAFGGGATAQVFGGRGAGNVLTRATAISASIFMLTSVSLAYISSSHDRALKEHTKATEAAKPKPKADAKTDTAAKSADKPAPGTSGTSDTTETPVDKAAPPVDKPAAPVETPASTPNTPPP